MGGSFPTQSDFWTKICDRDRMTTLLEEQEQNIEMVDQSQALYRNRSEAPTSVVLALLLAQPSLGRPLLRRLATSHSWQMWLRAKGQNARENLKIPEINLEASALVFPFRDASPETDLQPTPRWRGEIDIVAILPGHAVIGFELKVLSTTSGLGAQMDDQVAGLSLLADLYHCPFLAQIALSPTYPQNLNTRINRLSFFQLSQALEELGAADVSECDILAIAASQVDSVIDLIEPRPAFAWSYLTLDELQPSWL
jgi:hypothetical protein